MTPAKPTPDPDLEPTPEPEPESDPEPIAPAASGDGTDEPPGPETSEDYDRLFGGTEPIAEHTETSWAFDPTEAIKPLPVGRYPAVIPDTPTNPVRKQVSQNGNAMMYVPFVVTDGEYVGCFAPPRRFMLSGKGGGWTVEFLNAIGLEDEAKGLKDIVAGTVMGRHLVIHVRPQKNNPEFLEVWKCERHPDGPLGDEAVF